MPLTSLFSGEGDCLSSFANSGAVEFQQAPTNGGSDRRFERLADDRADALEAEPAGGADDQILAFPPGCADAGGELLNQEITLVLGDLSAEQLQTVGRVFQDAAADGGTDVLVENLGDSRSRRAGSLVG